MTMNKHVMSFTWSVLRLSSLCGLALALTGMTQASHAKACQICSTWSPNNSTILPICKTASTGYSSCYTTGGQSGRCYESGTCN
jgi:hypothetical protein